MAITELEARTQILNDLAAAVEWVALARSCLAEAFEQLSVTSAERMEADLYRPVQRAYGRARRTHDQFAQRYELPARAFESPSPGRKSQGAKAFIERAVIAAANAERGIAELQDTMLPVESGDAELRSGLAAVRELLAGVPVAARSFLRTLGR